MVEASGRGDSHFADEERRKGCLQEDEVHERQSPQVMTCRIGVAGTQQVNTV